MNDLGIIGLGTLGSALARGLRRALPQLEIFATTGGTSNLPAFVTHCASNTQLTARTRTVVICVKPHHARAVLDEIAPALSPSHSIVSACAAVPLDLVRERLPGVRRIARAMPNIASEYGQGVIGLSFAPTWLPEDRAQTLALFSALGETAVLDERHFDAITAVAGCGPAYVCMIAEALSDAGVKAGLPREVSRTVAVQTLLGSSVLLRSVGEHPAQVRDRVATPGGCTIDALAQLEEGRLRATLIAAVTTAAAKSQALTSRY